ncbi:MAG: dihydroorotase [candidate division Zixibacteria bacterium RBG_16_53_22]|nr:MAG: dihydroorotase [candidate division Zixibacteria bacterium RBG_16_53_22]
MNNEMVLTGAKIVDPVTGYFGPADIHIADHKIFRVDKKKKRASAKGAMNLKGLYLCPGFIDMHVHLREPGREDEETIQSGAEAAVAGGFTAVACMPNTEPALDSAEGIKFVIERARAARARVYPVGAITVGRKGETLAPMLEMADTGAVAFSDDGSGLQNGHLMRRALEYLRAIDLPIISHCEYSDLASGGVMNESFTSTVLGMKGIPPIAEELMVARDIMLAEYTGGRVHIAHVSTCGSVELIRRAKRARVRVTAEATPHHFTLTDELIRSFNTNLKVNPPLRTRKDVDAIKKGLKEGIIDVIATDHAPHSIEEKEMEFDYAPCGMIGLETAIGLVVTELIKKRILSWPEAVAKMTVNPARILNLPGGTFEVGAPADFTVIDPTLEWVVSKDDFRSLSKNSPFIGRKLTGRAVMTIVGGEIVHSLI